MFFCNQYDGSGMETSENVFSLLCNFNSDFDMERYLQYQLL